MDSFEDFSKNYFTDDLGLILACLIFGLFTQVSHSETHDPYFFKVTFTLKDVGFYLFGNK